MCDIGRDRVGELFLRPEGGVEHGEVGIFAGSKSDSRPECLGLTRAVSLQKRPENRLNLREHVDLREHLCHLLALILGHARRIGHGFECLLIRTPNLDEAADTATKHVALERGQPIERF
ncbi:hypothetical protein D9M71_410460 [compost metagenome]